MLISETPRAFISKVMVDVQSVAHACHLSLNSQLDIISFHSETKELLKQKKNKKKHILGSLAPFLLIVFFFV